MRIQSIKIMKLFAGIFGFFAVTYLFFDLVFGLSDTMAGYINNLPNSLIAAFVIILLLVADILIPVPASIVMVVSGILFGPLLGGAIALIGSMAGAIINFQVSRKLGQSRVKRLLGNEEYGNLGEIIRRYGAYAVILTRMVPLAMESVSSISGISDLKLKKFIILNIVGFTPITFLYAYSGALYKDESQNIFVVLLIGFFTPFIIWYLIAIRDGQ